MIKPVEAVDLQQPVNQEQEAPKQQSGICGHVNKHSLGIDRKQDFPTCVLSMGHVGDHQAKHKEYEKQYETVVVNGEEKTTVKLIEVEKPCWWGDMAGLELSEIPAPKPVAPPTLRNIEERLQALERGKRL